MISTGICRWLFLLISLSTWTKLIDSKEMRIVCYYTNWSVYRPGQAKFSPQNINPYLCTHLVYAFGGFTKENTLKPFDKYQDIEKGGYAKFTGLKTYNKNLKTMIAIGGWNEGSSRFSPMVANSDRRKELVKNAIKFLRQNHFDGLDLDWEYPTFRDGGKPRDRDNYAQLVKELREEFERESEKTGRPRLLLTMAVPAGIEYINKGYDVPKLTKYLDWMNILSYDYHSAFEPAVNHHAPLYSLEEDNEYNYDAELNIDYTIKHYLKLGADPNKLVLGIPTYGRSYTLFNPDAYEIGAPADGPGDMGEATRENGYLAYYEICEYIKDQDWEVEEPNPNAMGPIAFKDNQWVGYDDENIVRKKAEYVAENSLGGIMFWAIDNDDFRGNCHGKPYPLIEAAKEALINAYGLTEENLISPPSKPTKSPKQKSRNRTRKTTTTAKPDDSTVSSSTSGRRRRIKTKSRDEDRSISSSVQKRRKDTVRKAESSTYSSLKVITPAYTTPAPPATPDMGGAFKCEDEGFFPHPKDCKKYFWCLSGAGDTGIVAHQFTCPAGLYFNKGADSCDYSQNVLCNKKLQKATTSTTEKTDASTKASTSEKPTVSSIFSTSRVPPKITAATSKTTFVQRTTTEAYDDEYEYEDDEEETKPEEDPKVIKELIDLIKKAGGIEELEKQLKFGKDVSPTSASESTTSSTITKSLFERVLSKTSKNTLNALKKTSNNRNSGGPQSVETNEESKEKKIDRGRPQYKSIARLRPSTEKSVKDDDTLETRAGDEEIKEKKTFKNKSSLEYVNIRRPKSSSTTEANDDDEFSRNKILGETDDEEEDGDPEDTETVTKKSNTPQYVSIRRQRPTTTKPTATSSKYASIRRSTVSPIESQDNDNINNEDSDDEDDNVENNETNEKTKYKNIRRGPTTQSSTLPENQSFRYQTIRRGTTTSATPSENVQGSERSTTTQISITSEDDKTDTEYNLIRTSTTSSPEKEGHNETTTKYQTIRRGTTTPSVLITSDLLNSTPPLQEEEINTVTENIIPVTNLSQESPSSISSLATENIMSSTHESTTESNIDVSRDSLATSSVSPTEIGELVTGKKRPVLFHPRPFSVGTSSTAKPTATESTTVISKVSQSNLRFQLRQTTPPTSTTEASSTTIKSRSRSRISNINRNLNEDIVQEEKYERTEENKPVRTRKRLPVITEKPVNFNEEADRRYRPAELADLSSLTAADLNLRGGEFVSAHRRRRPTVATSTTTTTEKPLNEFEKTGSRTLPLVRKLIDPSSFGKNRRVILKNDDQINASSDQASTTRKIVRGFRSTTPKTNIEETVLERNTSVGIDTAKVTPRSRKIFRRVRPTSTTVAPEKPLSEEALITSTTIRTSTLLRKRIPLFRARKNKTEVTTNNASNDIIETTESITSSENPLLKLFKTRSRFEIAKNITAEDDEDDLANEPTDVLNGEEGENIKLSESNIRESSQINTFGFDEKSGRKFSKYNPSKSDILVKTTTEKQDELSFFDELKTTSENQESIETTTRAYADVSRTEPTRILRTRKIIRKITSTEPTTTTEKYQQRRKILRRPQPTNVNELETKTKDAFIDQNDQKYGSIIRTTTESIISEEPVEENIRKISRPSFGRRATTEKPKAQDDTNVTERNRFRIYRPITSADVASESTPRYNLYTKFSTTEYDEDDDESDNYKLNENDDAILDDDNEEEEDNEDDNFNDEIDDGVIEDSPKYTIYKTSSVKRTHKYESNTNFDDENEDDLKDGHKTNKSVSSLISTTALNSKNESEIIMDRDKESIDEKVDEYGPDIPKSNEKENEYKDQIEVSKKPNNLLHSVKERPTFTRQRLALSREEVQTKSQQDLIKTKPGYRSRFKPTFKLTTTTPTSTPITIETIGLKLDELPKTEKQTNEVDVTTNSFIKEEKEYSSSPLLETTEQIAVSTLTISGSEDENNSTDETILSTTEELKDTTLKHVTDEPIEFTHPDEIDETTINLDSEDTTVTTDLSTKVTMIPSESLNITATQSSEESTEKLVSNFTETTTEFRRRSTLRSIKERPKLEYSKRLTETSRLYSTTSSPNLEVSSRRSYTRTNAFGKHRSNAQAPSTLIKNAASTPLSVNKNKFSATFRKFQPEDTHKNDNLSFRDKEQPEKNEDIDSGVEEDERKFQPEDIYKEENLSFENKEQPKENEDIDSEIEEDEHEHEETVSQGSSSTTSRIINSPVGKLGNSLNKSKFVKTLDKAAPINENKINKNLGSNTEVIKNRNKSLFSKRKMNTPFKTPSSSVVTASDSLTSATVSFSDAIEIITTPSSIQTDSTDPNLTTLHHVFADIESTDSTTESMGVSPATNSGKVERLIEVNRIVEVKTKQAKVNHSGAFEEATKVEIVPTVDKIGEISRITLIKIVDGNNETIIKDPETNKIGTSIDSSPSSPVYVHEETKTPLEIAKVKEIPASEVLQNVNLKNIEFNINLDSSSLGEREDRKFEIFGESKLSGNSGNKILTSIEGKPDIIDGISHINIITPKPLATETSTISLQALFQTENQHLNPGFTTNDEVLETDRSEFVNVRVLDQDRSLRLDKGLLGNTNYIPVRILPQDDEEVTMKAHVVEIKPKPESRTIKIVPIRVEMSRSLANIKLPPSGNNT